MFNIRTDLAVEAHELYRETDSREEVPGVVVDTEKLKKISITRVHIKDKKGEEALGKKKGVYITLEIPTLIHKEQETFEDTIAVLSDELKRIMNLKEKDTVLVVGLGNWQITADSLGPKVTESLLITRHMIELMPEEIEKGVRPVCALSPGVLGLTGIETSEIIKGVVQRVKPSVIIAIDSLAARKLSRISTTIQLTDTGITPGAGIGNPRQGLSIDELGVPVIALGVPTVVDAATMANDTIDLIIDHLMQQTEQDSKFYDVLKNIDRDKKYSLIQQVQGLEQGALVVTPKEVDEIIEDISEIIANAINIAIHDSITLDDLNKYH
ncbi:MAG: Germination protease precursor [Firmicutes bacterium ADurb.Bin193]|nr:MAG: Germination protease precursor [Firmicutes bacterium ADurb.Bin193]